MILRRAAISSRPIALAYQEFRGFKTPSAVVLADAVVEQKQAEKLNFHFGRITTHP